MSNVIEIKVPDIGDFADVEVIEVLVNVGDTIQAEDSLISVESDKAAMEIPAPQGGVVKEMLVALGDKVSQGSSILMLEVGAEAATDAPAEKTAEKVKEEKPAAAAAAPAPQAAAYSGDVDVSAEVVVLGSGPGGYTAAFRAADLGKKVVLIERYQSIG
ncbi:MAG: biotin/lipoyl-containing protein, partial [Gammaproteobacteria bacterium]|nr:biotin/lipoyl-containing protein [Gammaproteobacteria bacterium]